MLTVVHIQEERRCLCCHSGGALCVCSPDVCTCAPQYLLPSALQTLNPKTAQHRPATLHHLQLTVTRCMRSPAACRLLRCLPCACRLNDISHDPVSRTPVSHLFMNPQMAPQAGDVAAAVAEATEQQLRGGARLCAVSSAFPDEPPRTQPHQSGGRRRQRQLHRHKKATGECGRCSGGARFAAKVQPDHHSQRKVAAGAATAAGRQPRGSAVVPDLVQHSFFLPVMRRCVEEPRNEGLGFRELLRVHDRQQRVCTL